MDDQAHLCSTDVFEPAHKSKAFRGVFYVYSFNIFIIKSFHFIIIISVWHMIA